DLLKAHKKSKALMSVCGREFEQQIPYGVITQKQGFIENIEEKPLDKFANDFRDSFRTFKNALIKDNNLLDASNFHKYELYC
ncbi:hypothetical protein VWN47_10825, partial [Campylobacter jejuni]